MKIDNKIKMEADRCVMCGLCLPHCPTYGKTRNEAESPRGRISLITALANNQLEADEKLRGHLDSCLLCRACESKCPSGVKFGEIMDGARSALKDSAIKKEYPISLDQLATNKKRQRSEATKLWLADKTGLRALGRGLGIVKAMGMERFEQIAPSIKRPHSWSDYYPTSAPQQGDVALFIGCFSDMFDQQTLDDAIKVLNAYGYGVHIPSDQTCCGAMHQHSGENDKALELARQNESAFSKLSIEAIINCASGCTSHMSEYKIHSGIELPVKDINTFLISLNSPHTPSFKPLKKRVAIHEPCSLRNVLKESHSLYSLLAQIPELEAVALPGNEKCCGAAGSYMIDHPEMADELRKDKLEAIADTQPDILVTANIGCSLHIASGAKLSGTPLEVLHPISLLARQLVA